MPYVKHWGGNLMLWGGFSGDSIGHLFKETGTMTRDEFRIFLGKSEEFCQATFVESMFHVATW